MSEPSKLTLKKSGVVLTGGEMLEGGELFVAAPILGIRYMPACRGYPAAAGICNEPGKMFDTEPEALAWLDARVLELRAALMPEDAPQRIIDALYDTGALAAGDWSDEEDLSIADAVLSALGIGAKP